MAGIYLHIPFCKQACTYCNFHFSTSTKGKTELLDALLKELVLQKDYLGGDRVETVYFGGGTPSLLPAGEINRIMDTIGRYYRVDTLTECTLEANPDDLSPAYLKSLQGTAIDRLSIGVQSFREADLRYMNRAHNAQQADYAIKAAQDKGFSNLTIDLIFGTPGLRDTDWRHNLSQVTVLGIPHFSAYALTVEEGTLLDHNIRKKKSSPVDPAQSAAQFGIMTEQAVIMGYEQYEISNLALPGHHALHNTSYWQGVPYLGVGPSAHSFNGHTRKWNVSNNALYTTNILQHNRLISEEEILTPVQQLNEYIMTSLRTMWGCSLDKIAGTWDNSYALALEKNSLVYQEKGRMIQTERTLRLTPEGKLFADGIAGALFFD
jgi:oxygen-independent coproporphyrinogen-3 oxidase